MYKRETYEQKPDRRPYFWVETPIGRLCFSRRLPSQERVWLNALMGTGPALRAEIDSAADMTEAEGLSALASITARGEAARGLYIARHWVDEAWALESIERHAAGAFHPSEKWPEDLPALDRGSDRYGWSVMAELSGAGLDVSDIDQLLSDVIAGAQVRAQPSQEDIDEQASFSAPPKACTTSP